MSRRSGIREEHRAIVSGGGSPPIMDYDLETLTIDEHLRDGSVSRKKLWFVLGITCPLLLGLGALAFLLSSRPIVQIAIARPAVADNGAEVLQANGYVTPRIHATVSAKITGQIVAIYFDEGMHVRTGQLLARLNESDAKAQLESAAADFDVTKASLLDLHVRLSNAESALSRVKKLQAAGIDTIEALEQAQTTVASLQAQINVANEQIKASKAHITVAQQNLANTEIRAPFAGVIVSKDAQIGEIVSPVSAGGGFTRTGIATIVDMKSLGVEVDVNESNYALIRSGQRTLAMLDAYPDWEIPSEVSALIPSANRQTATVKVRISFDNLDPRILPDMGVKVIFLKDAAGPAEHKVSTGLLVPRAAIHEDNGDSLVFLVAHGRIERRSVRLGNQRGNDVEVLAGVSPGDALVVKGSRAFHDGQAVDIDPKGQPF
jgi:RND family efflux transporter MFP subunit